VEQVQLQRTYPVLGRRFQQASSDRPARVGDQKINASQSGSGLRDEPIDLLVARHVGNYCQGQYIVPPK
jgi:hypothetical protein